MFVVLCLPSASNTQNNNKIKRKKNSKNKKRNYTNQPAIMKKKNILGSRVSEQAEYQRRHRHRMKWASNTCFFGCTIKISQSLIFRRLFYSLSFFFSNVYISFSFLFSLNSNQQFRLINAYLWVSKQINVSECLFSLLSQRQISNRDSICVCVHARTRVSVSVWWCIELCVLNEKLWTESAKLPNRVIIFD